MAFYRGLTPLQEEIGKLNIPGKRGSWIPDSWLHHLRRTRRASTPRKDSKAEEVHSEPDWPALMILSEIVYRYRPIIVAAEDGTVEVGRSFREDMWQARTAYFTERFSLSEKTVNAALKRLREDYGVIRQELRFRRSKSGTPLYNARYLAPVIDRIREISEDIPKPDEHLEDTAGVEGGDL